MGIGKGAKTKIGEVNGEKIYSYEKSETKLENISNIEEILKQTIENYAVLEDDKTNSGYVITDNKPSFSIYLNTVKKIVKLSYIEKKLKELNALFKGYKNKRGLIGATASIAWLSDNDKTFELLTYREQNKWGSTRFVDDESVKKMDKKNKTTFDNYDYKNIHNRLTPSSPCPILYGIRGENPKDLENAKSMIISEKVDRWLVFETNQGTDDHLDKKKISEIKPYDSVIAIGVVCKTPKSIKGGHVIFSIKDSTGEIDCAAYEPSKEFRDTVRKLVLSDIVEVYGGIRKEPITINLEKIRIKKLVKNIIKVENPICPKCGKHMKSIGFNQGFKCKKCKIKSKKAILKEMKRDIKIGFYEVPVCARRHLSKPLKRINHKAF